MNQYATQLDDGYVMLTCDIDYEQSSFLASRGFAARRSLTRVANCREKKRLLAVYM